MLLSNKIENVINVLAMLDEFSDVKIIRAYPNAIKPTRLSNAVIAVCDGELKLESVSCDNDAFFGKGCVRLNFFSPIGIGKTGLLELVQNAIYALASNEIFAISVNEPFFDSYTDCYRQECKLKFSLDMLKENADE